MTIEYVRIEDASGEEPGFPMPRQDPYGCVRAIEDAQQAGRSVTRSRPGPGRYDLTEKGSETDVTLVVNPDGTGELVFSTVGTDGKGDLAGFSSTTVVDDRNAASVITTVEQAGGARRLHGLVRYVESLTLLNACIDPLPEVPMAELKIA